MYPTLPMDLIRSSDRGAICRVAVVVTLRRCRHLNLPPFNTYGAGTWGRFENAMRALRGVLLRNTFSLLES